MSPVVAPLTVTLTPATHRFFDDLVTALASHAGLLAGYLNHAGNLGYRFLDDWPLSMPCLTWREAASDLEIVVTPANILTPLTKFSWPASLDLDLDVRSKATSAPPVRYSLRHR
jgi:hypothetical protein